MEGSAGEHMDDREKANGGMTKAGEGKIVKGEVDYGLFAGSTLPSQDVCYQALLSGDPHFDGLLFVGVSSTGIYCRVGVCWAKVPKRENCTFFKTAAEAEAAGYRPCLKCRPELAPGTPIAPDIDHAVARAAASMRERPGDAPIARIATEQGMSERHLRRLFEQTYGVSPAQYRETCRLLLAKSLLTDTELSITRIAYASGFASVRRFNDAFVNSYGMQPTRFRKSAQDSISAKTEAAPIVLHVDYREPYRFDLLLGFLQMRAIEGVEAVLDGAYWRIVRASDGERAGWVKVENDPSHRRLAVTISPELFGDIPSVLARTRRLFDTDCVPGAVEQGLADFYEHAGETYRIPGIRVPCAFDGFEMATRAILGQQITVKAASTLAGRVAREFGTQTKGPIPELTCAFPLPQAFCADDAPARLGEVGVIAQRANAICAIARAMEAGELTLHPGADLVAEAARLGSIRGIGDWTVQYVLMRAYDYPDAFLPTDYGVKLALPDMKPRELEKLSQPWCPWRSYAVMSMWSVPHEKPKKSAPKDGKGERKGKGACGVSPGEHGERDRCGKDCRRAAREHDGCGEACNNNGKARGPAKERRDHGFYLHLRVAFGRYRACEQRRSAHRPVVQGSEIRRGDAFAHRAGKARRPRARSGPRVARRILRGPRSRRDSPVRTARVGVSPARMGETCGNPLRRARHLR